MKRVYDCDTHDYWCSETDYDNRDRTFGAFLEDGAAYRIFDPDTPRPWLNYFANANFGSVISNTGLGFTWYRSTLLRITKYEHPIDYLPRDFLDGREVVVTDMESSQQINVFRDGADLVCTHCPGRSTIEAHALGLRFAMTVFVPVDDPCEIWLVKVSNPSATRRRVRMAFQQTWSLAKFGIHTAEAGIPYLTVPGQDLAVTDEGGVFCHSTNAELPYELFGMFMSPQTTESRAVAQTAERADGRSFTFHQCELASEAVLDANTDRPWEIVSGATTAPSSLEALKRKYAVPGVAAAELQAVIADRNEQQNALACTIPDKNLQHFLNVWFKNQLKLVFHFVRSGQNGYRDSLQDAWGWTLLDVEASTARLVDILSHQCADGTAPRQFSSFGDGQHDMRRFMDSPVWMARTLVDLVKESGDFSLQERSVPFLDGPAASVDEHVWRALDYLYQHRGQQGMCLTGDGDWNDALEGISKDGAAVSTWLTIALYDGMRLMIELYDTCGRSERAALLRQRCAEIKRLVNDNAWDGEWYVYGFTGSGKPIGSKDNREGKIHLNAQTWAVFSGLADPPRAAAAMTAVEQMLGTGLGPMLLVPPYVDDAAEVGRIANLEPGTFENGSIYQHAVAFYVYACIANGNHADAYRAMVNLLPTNPHNFDCRRTSEPYCTGNYYCGAGHPRFGQNFFTWFTGNAAWLLRAGFDEILGVKAGFDGLEISPKVPDAWDGYEVQRRFRGCLYDIRFEKADDGKPVRIAVDGVHVNGNVIPVAEPGTCSVHVFY